MPRLRISDVVPRDDVAHRTLKVLGHDVDLSYYRNRITLERDRPVDAPDGEEPPDEEARTARDLCHIVASWDLVGPVQARDGTTLVAEDAPVPLAPYVVAAIPLRFTNALTTALIEDAFPNQTSGRGSRRR